MKRMLAIVFVVWVSLGLFQDVVQMPQAGGCIGPPPYYQGHNRINAFNANWYRAYLRDRYYVRHVALLPEQLAWWKENPGQASYGGHDCKGSPWRLLKDGKWTNAYGPCGYRYHRFED